MSTLKNSQMWSSISKEDLNSKYEKCLNITEEIYKRINITFQIKKLETASHSDESVHSDQIDSNDLSNETDLFACDKTDSLPSSEPETTQNNNNYNSKNSKNNSEKKTTLVYKRPKKRFRKRVKKRASTRASDSDGSSDEGAPLSYVGVPCYVALTKDVKPKILSSEKSQSKKSVAPLKHDTKSNDLKTDKNNKEASDKGSIYDFSEEKVEENVEKNVKSCTMCSMSFKADRGLRRHIAISHSISEEKITRLEREVKPA